MAAVVPVQIKLTGVPELDAGLQKVAGSFNVTKMAVEGMVGAFAAGAVIEKIVGFLKEAHSISQQYRTETGLLTAQLGHYSVALDDQADALAKSLYLQKNDILAADQRLLVYTREEKSIKALIPGIIDLAKLKNIDLVTASNNVGIALKKADESAVGAKVSIKGLGISFKTTGTEAGNAAVIQDLLTKAVGGGGKAAAESLDIWSKLGIRIKQFKEDISIGLFGGTKQQKDLREYNEALATLQTRIGPVNPQTGEAHDATEQQLKAAFDLVNAYEKKQAESTKKVDNLAAGVKNEIITNANEKLQKELESIDLGEKRKALVRDRDAAIAAGEDKVLVARVYGEKIAKVDEEQSKKKIEIADKETSTINDLFSKLGEDDDNDLKDSVKSIGDANKYELQQAEDLAKEKQKIDEDAFAFQQMLLSHKIENEQRASKLIMQNGKEQLRFAVGNLDTLAHKHKEFTGAYKILAVAQATMDTYSAANKALASLPPPLNFIAMGIDITAGLANVSQIASQKMAYGGVVRGGQPGVDSVPAMLMPGEIVYNPAHPNASLAAMINNSSNTTNGDTEHYHISMPITVNGNPTNTQIAQIVEVTHRALFTAITKAQNAGKLSIPGMKIRA